MGGNHWSFGQNPGAAYGTNGRLGTTYGWAAVAG
jgi:hypothetical protein